MMHGQQNIMNTWTVIQNSTITDRILSLDIKTEDEILKYGNNMTASSQQHAIKRVSKSV
jgi:hypothetical protein